MSKKMQMSNTWRLKFWLTFGALVCVFSEGHATDTGDIGAAHAKKLVRLVRQDCGSCHGLLLKGGLGPSLLPEALAGKPAQSLVATILAGRKGTPMPGWLGLITEQEAQWIVERLLTEFPSE